MVLALLVGLGIGYASWAGCLESLRTGRLPYAAGYNLFSIVHNLIIAPIGLIKVFGLLYGLIIAAAAWFVVFPIVVGPGLHIAFARRPHILLLVFATMFWANLALVFASLFIL